MKNLQRVSLSVLVLAAAGLSTGCATTYDPVEVCSTQWIKPRADKAVASIKGDTQSVFKNLRKVATVYREGKTPNPIQLFKLSNSVKNLERELKNGRGIKDLKILRDTCKQPSLVTDALTDFMKDQGLPEQMITFIKKTEMFDEVTGASIKRPMPEGTIGS